MTPVKFFAKFKCRKFIWCDAGKKVTGQCNRYREPGNGGNPAGTAPVKGLPKPCSKQKSPSRGNRVEPRELIPVPRASRAFLFWNAYNNLLKEG
ncbi:MAG: hypothetical protein C4554_00285 [Dethiobacter sp.]|nr:MAG: hypothetical protein C4554_00285 [Dethiobacter sp.]